MAATTGQIDNANRALSESDRMPKGALTMVWWSMLSAMFYLVLGATLALRFGTRAAIAGAVLGTLALSAFGYVASRYAMRTGRSCYLISQELFGTGGASLVSLIFAVTSIYYAVFETSIVGIAASKVVPHLSYQLACIIIVIYSVLLVVGSVQHWLDKLNGVLLPLYLGGLALVVWLGIRHYGYSNAWLTFPAAADAPPGGWWNCFMAYFGQMALIMVTIELARFGRPQDARYHGWFAFGLPFYLIAFVINSLVGIFLAAELGMKNATETAVMDVCLTVLGGPLGLFFIWVTQTRINTANYFIVSTNLQALFRDAFRLQTRKVTCLVVAGVIVLYFLLSADQVLKYILVAVSYQAVMLTAWVGVAFSFILGPHEASDRTSPAPAPSFAFHALGAWALSAAIGIGMLLAGGYASTLSVPTTLVVAWAAYRVARRRDRLHHAPRALDSTPL